MLTTGDCPINALSIKDTLQVLEGKWKMLILFALYHGPMRFGEIAKEVVGISDKVLSKELKSLEVNKLVERHVQHTFPPTVEYSITAHGRSLERVIEELHYWGILHRKEIIGK